MHNKTSQSSAETSTNQRNSRETFERNFITYTRALNEFMLKPSNLETLKKYYRRSPYESESSILVFNRKDVEKIAIEIWGSLENLEREKKTRDLTRIASEQYNYEMKKNLKHSRRTESSTRRFPLHTKRKTNEYFAITIALVVDFLNVIFKLLVWAHTHSNSLLAEMIHSAADTINQTVLVIGLCQLAQRANRRHPYGYSNMMYVVSLISAVGVFCLGAAVSVFNGILSLTMTRDVSFEDIEWAFAVLGFSTTTDAVCCVFSIIAIVKASRQRKIGFFSYAFRSFEPGLTAVLLEDFVAVLGNIVAAVLLATSWSTGNLIPDAVGSVVIGVLLGIIALFLIVTNSAALVGRSIPEERLQVINKILESDIMIRAIHDVKGMDMGNNLVRYKAEIDFDGAELTRLYLDRINLNDLLSKVKEISNIDDLEAFMVAHGENIVDLVGGEIDRIEFKVRSIFPEIRHMDLEIL